jgi:hypothetical protein
MLCLPCLERRLGRYLRLEDFNPPVSERVAKYVAQRPTSGCSNFSLEGSEESDEVFDDSPMDWDDYGLIDELTPDAIGQIDAALKSLATAKPKKVAAIIGRVMGVWVSAAGVGTWERARASRRLFGILRTIML